MAAGERQPIAITGLDTYVGHAIVECLLTDDPTRPIIGLDLALPRRLEGRVLFHRVDLTEPTADSTLADLLAKHECKTLLHGAFLSRPDPDVGYAHELEVIGSLHVMNAVAAAGVEKLVVTSSARVYGAYPDNPNYLTEEHPLRAHPSSQRVRDRAEMEELLALFADRHPDVVVTSLRPCWIMGEHVDSEAVRHFAPARVTTVMGFDPLMQFLHEDDWIDAIQRVLEVDAPGSFNLAGDGVLPLSTYLSLAGKRARSRPHPLLYRAAYLQGMWQTGAPPAAFYDYLRYLWVLDTRRARETFGFSPRYTSKEAWMAFVVSRRLRRYR